MKKKKKKKKAQTGVSSEVRDGTGWDGRVKI